MPRGAPLAGLEASPGTSGGPRRLQDRRAGRSMCEGSVAWPQIRVSGVVVFGGARLPGRGGGTGVGAKVTLPVGASSGLAAENGHQVNKPALPEVRCTPPPFHLPTPFPISYIIVYMFCVA